MTNTIPHDICQELILMVASALNLDPTVLEECIVLLPEFNPVDILEAAESVGTHNVATLRALLEGDKTVDAWVMELEEAS